MVVNVWFVFLGYCPTMFDGFACVNSTMDEEIVNVSCPNFTQMGFDAKSKLKLYRNSKIYPLFYLQKSFKKQYIKKGEDFSSTSRVVYVARLDILFPSNHNSHKSPCGLCFCSSDPLIERLQ